MITKLIIGAIILTLVNSGVVYAGSPNNISCPDTYSVGKIDGIELCLADVRCDEGEYLNWFDKCMNHAFCMDNLDLFDCRTQFNDKPTSLPIDCEKNPDHPYCNGKRGQDGNVFCDLQTIQSSCWDNDEYEKDDPLVHCVIDPETKEECKINDQ